MPNFNENPKVVNIEEAKEHLAAKISKNKEGDKESPEFLVNLGVYFYGRRELDKAKDCFTKALKADPNYALAWFNLGTCFDYLNQTKEAIKHYEKAIKCDPNYANTYYNLALLYINNPFAAISNYEKYLEHSDSQDKDRDKAIKAIAKLKERIEQRIKQS